MRRNLRLFALLLTAALLLSGCSHISLKKTSPDPQNAAPQPNESVPTAEGTAAPFSETAAEPGTAAPNAGENPVPVQRTGSGVNPLTGMPGYDSDYYAGRRAIGVVVENHPGARPQWGMSTPDILVEYEVEGGITRMLWLYANEDEMPEKIGPVRSMRHDIVELARSWDLVFIHCGGSSFARDALDSYGGAVPEVDAANTDVCFVRDQSRDTSMEHRLILRGDLFRSSLQFLGLNMNENDPNRYYFRFADAGAPFRPGIAACSSVHFEYSPEYTYTFDYNAASGLYEASINGAPQLDDAGIRCAYKNAVLLYTDMVDMHTEAKHQDLLLENGGSGIYFCNGGYTEIRWTKRDDNDRLRLFGPDGSELTLNAGKTYIGFVRATQQAKTVIG